MQISFTVRNSFRSLLWIVAVGVVVLAMGGCGSGGATAETEAVASDPQKAAMAAQRGAAADAANQQARQADEARRAASRQAPQ